MAGGAKKSATGSQPADSGSSSLLDRHKWAEILVGGVLLTGIAYLSNKVVDLTARISMLEGRLNTLMELRAHVNLVETKLGDVSSNVTEIKKAMASLSTVEFEKPLSKTEIPVGKPFYVQGTVRSAPGDKDFWIVHRRVRYGLGWPRENKVSPTSDGRFGHEDWDHGAPGLLWVCLMAVDRDVSSRFDAWLENGRGTQKWNAIDVNGPGIQELGCVDVRLVQP